MTDRSAIGLVPLDPRILRDGHELLRSVSRPVEAFDDTLRALVAVMVSVMDDNRGLGLAAIQIGVPLRVIVVRVEELHVMVNPKLVRVLRRDVELFEGCLSVPRDQWRPISRPAKCTVEWQDLSGETRVEGFAGMTARALLHEIDHLDGVLITSPRPTLNGVHHD